MFQNIVFIALMKGFDPDEHLCRAQRVGLFFFKLCHARIEAFHLYSHVVPCTILKDSLKQQQQAIAYTYAKRPESYTINIKHILIIR